MAIIHNTMMSPGKLELLTSWLPAQPWYLDAGREPELTRAGGFRLDDPQGEVGIEFMVVADGSGERVATYLVPMTYRAAALAGADGGLIGTGEHGVLGRRWIYDGVHDPVLVGQLIALIQGDAEPQAQTVSDSADPTVASQPVADGSLTAVRSAVAANEPAGTKLRVETASADGVRSGELVVRLNRLLQSDGTAPADGAALADGGAALADGGAALADGGAADDGAERPCVSASWRLPDGTRVRGVFVTGQFA